MRQPQHSLTRRSRGVVSSMSSLAGLSALELGRLRMSVGYGTHRRARPLSPVEVGTLLRKARMNGASLTDCAEAVQLHSTGISRFLRVLDFPSDLLHLIDWGSGKDFVGFSAAVEVTKLTDAVDQRVLAGAILASNLNSKEVRQVTQLRQRSGRSIKECVREVLRMRPTVVRRYVFIGSVASEDMEELRALAQSVRDSMLAEGIEKIGLESATGRLGVRFFTLVGDERFNAVLRKIGKEAIEAQVRGHISRAATDVTLGG